MGEKENLIKGIKEFKAALSREKKIEKIILFGSRARNTHKKESDVDLIIVSPSFRNVKYCRAAGLHKYWKLNYPVDFICYTPEEFERLKKTISIVSEAVREGVEIK
jgi:hypothetical protein